MRYLKTRNTYKASNFEFNLDTMRATSYCWYSLVEKAGDMVYLNTYRYSTSTVKHIAKARLILIEQGIEYTEVEAPQGLGHWTAAISWVTEQQGYWNSKYQKSRKGSHASNQALEKALDYAHQANLIDKIANLAVIGRG